MFPDGPGGFGGDDGGFAGQGCTTWLVSGNGEYCDELATGQSDGEPVSDTPGLINIGDGPGKPCTFFTNDNDNNSPSTICIGGGYQPVEGDTVSVTNPSGHAGDPVCTGTIFVSSPPGVTPKQYSVKICPKKANPIDDTGPLG